MTAAFAFYLYRSVLNRIVARVKRLRRPKYLVSALAGLAYLYAVYFRQFLAKPHVRAVPHLAPDSSLLWALEIVFAILLLILVLAPWFSFARPSALFFTEAEIQFLFPAPVSRRALLRFRIARGQIAIIFGVLVSVAVLAGPGLIPHRVFLGVTVWVVYSFLALYRMGTALAKTSLAEHGVAGLRRQLWVAGLVLAVVVGVVAWLRWYVPPFPIEGAATPGVVVAWLRTVVERGPARFLLLPFRTLIRPASAADTASFLLRLGPALGILALAYGWVLNSHARFEEASLARAEATARRVEANRSGIAAGRPANALPVLFRLVPYGPAHSAFLWKNLISVGRVSPWRLVFVVVAIAASVGLSSIRRQSLLMMIGGMAGGVAVFLTLLGPVILRNDLRMDLLHLDVIKTYPVPGWRIVLGEVLAPAVLLTAAEWFLILIATATLTGLGRGPWVPAQKFAFCLAAMMMLPALSAIALLVQNGAALTVPGWIHLGRAQQRGIEAMGQRLITMIATVVVLAVAVIPAGAVFAAAYYPSRWLLGYAAIPLAAVVSCGALLIEAAAAVAWLGRMFDRFDPSSEIIDS